MKVIGRLKPPAFLVQGKIYTVHHPDTQEKYTGVLLDAFKFTGQDIDKYPDLQEEVAVWNGYLPATRRLYPDHEQFVIMLLQSPESSDFMKRSIKGFPLSIKDQEHLTLLYKTLVHVDTTANKIELAGYYSRVTLWQTSPWSPQYRAEVYSRSSGFIVAIDNVVLPASLEILHEQGIRLYSCPFYFYPVQQPKRP